MAGNNSFPSALPPATELHNGGYSLAKVLGQGGFGITYLGEDAALRRPVAIKEFFPPGSQRQARQVQPPTAVSATDFAAARETFLAEARSLALFQHPNIVDVYTVFSENNTVYMVMEYLEGQDLEKIISQRGPFKQAEALKIIAPACRALEVLHSKGFLHQDIKPENLILTNDGRVVLIDFGLTKKLEGGNNSTYGTVVFSGNSRAGTPGYAPLEQYGRQGRLGTYTDVYALAATAYFLLTGQTPPDATDRATGQETTDVRALNLTVNDAVGGAIMNGLTMDIDSRPQTINEFWQLLQRPAPSPASPVVVQPAPVIEPELEEPNQHWEPAGTVRRRPSIPQLDFESIFRNFPTPRPNRMPPQPVPRPVPLPGCGSGCGGCGCGAFAFIMFIIFEILSMFR